MSIFSACGLDVLVAAVIRSCAQQFSNVQRSCFPERKLRGPDASCIAQYMPLRDSEGLPRCPALLRPEPYLRSGASPGRCCRRVSCSIYVQELAAPCYAAFIERDVLEYGESTIKRSYARDQVEQVRSVHGSVTQSDNARSNGNDRSDHSNPRPASILRAKRRGRSTPEHIP